MSERLVILITGTRKGIGRYLAQYYVEKGYSVIGCSRQESAYHDDNYQHFCLDITDERAVLKMFKELKKTYKRLDCLINNAGIASMNHCLLTPVQTVRKVLDTNITGSFLMAREATKLMLNNRWGRIVNFATIATPLKLEGEAIYASSKSAIISLTQIMAKELAEYNITVNAIGPTPIKTDLIAGVPPEKIERLLQSQAIHRWGEFQDIANVLNFFIQPESDFITGQVIFLGGIS